MPEISFLLFYHSHRLHVSASRLQCRPGALLTQREVGLILGLSERTVREVEKEALAKLRRALMTFWREWTEGEIEEGSIPASWALTRAETAAVCELARTHEERRALRKLLVLAAG